MDKSAYKNIDEYILLQPPAIQEILQKIRETIKDAAPGAEEAISYRIPTFRLGGNLVHFAAFKNHISFFPTASGIANFTDELSKYEVSKGTVRFPVDKEIPYKLISKITKFRVKEITEKIKRQKK